MAEVLATHEPLIGRTRELTHVAAVLDGAVRGMSGTLLITGEAGVGKTRVARSACDAVGAVMDVVWVTCLPLTLLATPLLPLTAMLRRRSAGGAAIDLGAGDSAAFQFDAWIDQISEQRPMAVVVDDLHWADESTLDVLHYVVAGPAERRLAVLATIRDGEIGEGHQLHRWLADVRRLPRVDQMAVGRLDRLATREQLTLLLGEPPQESLVDAVFLRSQGNPYLTTLLSRGLAPNATSVTAEISGELADALARSWHGLSTPTRDLTRLLAVCGQPMTSPALAKAANAVGEPGDVLPLLHEATASGFLELRSDDTHWFTHPLTAEVLEASLLPDERRRLHTAVARLLADATPDPALADPAHVVAIADQYWRAGLAEESLRWALLAADAAERAGGHSERIRLLRRALELLPRDQPPQATMDLLQKVRVAAERAGDQTAELTAIEELLDGIDPRSQPLVVTALLVRRSLLRGSTGREFLNLENAKLAVELSSHYPDSPEHALALGELARVELWHDVPSGPATAQEALARARAARSPKALSFALTARVMAHCMRTIETDSAITEMGRQAQRAALEAEDYWAFLHATAWLCNSIDYESSDDVLGIRADARAELVSRAAPHSYLSALAADEAQGRLYRGDFRGTAALLRIALGSMPGPVADIGARLAAAKLSCRQGRQNDAEAHLLRAEEMFPALANLRRFDVEAVRAEVALGRRDQEAALAAAMVGLESEGGAPPTGVERLAPFAARALADEAQAARDRGLSAHEPVRRLRELRGRFPTTVADRGPGTTYPRLIAALNAIYEAEVLRGLEAQGAAAVWRKATELCVAAMNPWDEAYAAWRAAEAGLAEREDHDLAAEFLRRGHRLATELQALPLLSSIESLAASARIPLAEPALDAPTGAAQIPGLTPREREILAEVVAGRTYSEIAKDLFISEKTVSVHISNLLRKTGTANRQQLAQLATRLAGANPAT